MKKKLHRLTHEKLPGWDVAISNFCHRSVRYFYIVLALLFTLIAAITSFLEIDVGSINQSTFDSIMKMRWASPPASKDIVILDIDEKSLAALAPEYGRWPWKRDVFAQVLAELENAEAKSIMFTVLVTDPDKDHPRSDASLSYVASESFSTVYPVVRLPAKFDAGSKLKICDLIPAGVMECHTRGTIAAIIPALPGMQHDLAIMNNRLDEDGILREWSLLWDEGTWKMPTMVGGALALAQVQPKVYWSTPYILNWRTRQNRYQRISLSDYIATLQGDRRIAPGFFKGKNVIIVASAPGLTTMVSTSVGLRDNGEVLATALDDAMHGTYLRKIPDGLSFSIAAIFIWLLALLFTFSRSKQSDLNGIFAAIEGGAVGVMALAMNYSDYYIDLMPMVTYGLVYYTIAQIHHKKAESVFMGKRQYLANLSWDEAINAVSVITFMDEKHKFLPTRRDLVAVQKRFPHGRVFIFNRSFQGDQLLEGLNHVGTLVLLANKEELEMMQRPVLVLLKRRGLKEFKSETFEFPEPIRQDRKLVPQYIGVKALSVMTQLPVAESV